MSNLLPAALHCQLLSQHTQPTPCASPGGQGCGPGRLLTSGSSGRAEAEALSTFVDVVEQLQV